MRAGADVPHQTHRPVVPKIFSVRVVELEITPEPTPEERAAIAQRARVARRRVRRTPIAASGGLRGCSRTSSRTATLRPVRLRHGIAAQQPRRQAARSRARRSRSARARLPSAQTAIESSNAPAAARPPSPAATACVQVLRRPRSRAWSTVPRSSAASRRPETSSSRATISATIQPGNTPSPTSRIITVSTSSLSATGSRSEPSADVLAAPPREPAVEPVSRHRDGEQRRRPVVVVREVPDEEDDHDRRRRRPAPASTDRRCSRVRRIRPPCRPSRRFSSPTAARSPIRVCRTLRELDIALGRHLLRGRPRLAARALRGRGVPRRPGRARRELPEPGTDPRRGEALGRRGGSPGLRVPRRERRTSRARSRPPASSGSARRRRRWS